MHDIADLERRGVVGVLLCSSRFEEAARTQGAALGFPAPFVLFPHPVQDRTDDELRASVDAVYSALVRAITASREG